MARSNSGRLTPAAVVAEATPITSVLHPVFEWNDKKAGHFYRIEQARTVIRTVKYEVDTEYGVLNAPYFLRDPTLPAAEPGYTTIERLRTDEDQARDCLIEEARRVQAALMRMQAVAGALNLSKDIENLRRQITLLSKKIDRPQASA